MMPHEVNALIAKVVFVIASAFALCMAKVRAEELRPVKITPDVSQVRSIN